MNTEQLNEETRREPSSRSCKASSYNAYTAQVISPVDAELCDMDMWYVLAVLRTGVLHCVRDTAE